MPVRIVISAAGDVELEHPGEFTSFSVAAADPAAGAVLRALGENGSQAAEDDHVFVTTEAVRRFAGEHADDAWESGLSKMVAYAATKGWMTEAGDAIKAHIEQL